MKYSKGFLDDEFITILGVLIIFFGGFFGFVFVWDYFFPQEIKMNKTPVHICLEICEQQVDSIK